MMSGILSLCLILIVALILPGVINRIRAKFAGRKGVRFLQHVRNVRVMLSKGVVTGHTTTLLFKAVPSIYLGAAFTAVMFVPFAGNSSLLSFNGDIVLFCYLLALGRMSLILAALDTGSSFEGMGASREALYGAMIEPALFIVAGTMCLLSGFTSFSGIYAGLNSGSLAPEMTIVMLLLVYVIVKVITVECGRIPVDDPRTHLELTMIHEVMVLDYSGVDLAMITIAGWLKMAVLAVIGAGIAASVTGGGYAGVLIWCVLIASIIAIVESFVARNKMSRNTTYILTIVSLAFVVFMVAYMLRLDISLL